MIAIRRLTALQILDSRGRPTIQATCELASGAMASASIPSGASTGTAEALELRDGDPSYYRGLGCRKAVGLIKGEINTALSCRSFTDQAEFDNALIELDGTQKKERLGANSTLAVSLALARSISAEQKIPLYKYFADVLGKPLKSSPRPVINLFSGGKHAGGQVDVQDVLLVPLVARTIDEALAMSYEVWQMAAEHVFRRYGMRTLTADEGGLAPLFPHAEAMLEDAVSCISAAGYVPGLEFAIAIDVASSHFYRDALYHPGDTRSLTSDEMIKRLIGWVEDYPIVSVEDGLAEEDWSNWPELCRSLAGRTLVVGDDLLCTNPSRIRRAIDAGAANALLLKLNQIGTLTEGATACTMAQSAGWDVMVSARSGETEDNWLADLAVGWSGDQIKVGSITQSERLVKYNRLLEIEETSELPIAIWPLSNRSSAIRNPAGDHPKI
jgi:enolase